MVTVSPVSRNFAMAEPSAHHRQVFWLPGHTPTAPSHPAWHVGTVAFAAVVAGYSGASAADFHGLPYFAPLGGNL